MSTWLPIAGWCVGWLLLWRVPPLANRARRAKGPDRGQRPYAVVIPARNEAHNLDPLLAGLTRQTLRPAEVVVVDDDSGDGTAALARAAGATVVASSPVPPGWTGKTWACDRGARATSSPVLVFLDADVRVAPEAMEHLVLGMVDDGALATVAPWHVVRRPYEWLSLFFNVVSVMGTGLASPIRRRAVGAFGPCVALTRADYEAIGGHAAVRGECVEDLALARVATEHGLAVRHAGGGELISYRMYPRGVRALIEGWSKNIATGARFTPLAPALLVAVWVTGALGTIGLLLDPRPATVAVIGLWLVQVAWMARQVGSFPVRSVLAFPVLAAAFAAVFLRSVMLVAIHREVTWSGRRIPLVRREP